MIPFITLLAITVVPVTDPLAPLQLLQADVTSQRDSLRVCVKVRNESPEIIDHVDIMGSFHESQRSGGFSTSAPAMTGKQIGVAPGGEFSACASAPGAEMFKGTTLQITIK
jgi:hypothetical protein